MTASIDPILARFRDSLVGVYGDKLERVVLFGSRARGEAEAGSDYDIIVFLNGPGGFGLEAGRLAAIETAILMDTGAVINALPLDKNAYQQRTAFMAEVRRDGLDI